MSDHFVQRRQVEFSMTDMAGIVHFSHYYLFMESAEHGFFRQCGLSIHTRVDGAVYSWPRVSCGFDFLRPLRFEDAFDVALNLDNIGGKSLRFRCEVRKGDEVCARGQSVSACCLIRPGGQLEAAAIPPNIRERLTAAIGSHPA